MIRQFFASRWGIISVGAFIGVFAPLLQKWGNPGNMGICVACFERDIAGALGLHRAAVVQYMRPEIIGFVLGALIAAYLFKEFRPRAGSAPIARFVLGAFAMIGALVFLGCPWRAMLRLAGGDLNAIFGILGLVGGIWIGTWFLRGGYNLGRAEKTHTSVGWLLPLIMLGFLALMLLYPQVAGQDKSGVLFYSINESQTWTDTVMTSISGNTYTGEIPGFEEGAYVQYKILAYDGANNLAVEDNAGDYYIYTVIPELQKFIILMFIITTSLAAILAKTRNNHK